MSAANRHPGALPVSATAGRGTLLALFAFLLCSAPLPAHGDTLYWLGAKLPNGPTYDDGGGDPMKYLVDETQSAPGGLPVASVEQEIRAAYQRWQDVPCAYIGFSFQGAITDPTQLGTHADSTNVMGTFINDSSDPRYASELGNGVAVGVALTYKNNGVILGCDTEFNHADYTFSDDSPASHYDFPSLANHENGHCLGLDHDPDDFNSVMYPSVASGDLRRELDAHDIDNACQLYPVAGAVGSPCTTAPDSCGSGLHCIQNPASGGTFCSQGCAVADTSSCPAGFGCKSSSAISGSSAACFPGNGDLTSNVGGACQQNPDCHGTNGLCFPEANGWPAGYCSQLCNANDPASCPSGDLCVNLGPNTYCMATCKTTVPQGTGQSNACRPGYACYAYDAAGDGFCYPACTDNASCGGNVCLCDGVCYVSGNGASWVGNQCLSANDCPAGDFCIPAGAGWQGGYCAAACGAGQNACRGCDPGASCVIAGAEGEAYCLQDCDSHGGCRPGYTCVVKQDADHGTRQVCAPGCASDGDCPVGERCEGGSCIDPYAPDAGSCALCGDGGVVQATTGGSTGSGGDSPAKPGGCGCGPGGVDPAELALLATFLGALVRRRRSW